MHACVCASVRAGERDLEAPAHVDKATKLLATNSANVNITLNPI